MLQNDNIGDTTTGLNQSHYNLLKQLARNNEHIVRTALGNYEVHDANDLPTQVIQARNFAKLMEFKCIEQISEKETPLGTQVSFGITLLGRSMARGTNPRTWVVYKVFDGNTQYMLPLDHNGYHQGWTSDVQKASRFTVKQAKKFYDQNMQSAGQPGGAIAGFGYREVG